MKYSWYRIDNSAIMYQMILTPIEQSLFRVGLKLTEDVEPAALKAAVDKTFLRYPQYKSEIKRGFFRPYLDENRLPFEIEENDGVLLKILDFSRNNRYLLRVSYFKKRIFVDFFHGLCDGAAGAEFLKTLAYHYFEALGSPIPATGILTLSDPPDPGETEDGFDKYYVKPSIRRGIGSMASGRAFHMKGRAFSSTGFGLIQATVPTDKLLATARSLDCSITVLLTAIAFDAVSTAYLTKPPKRRLTAFVPIDLRRRFPSKTLGNFTIFAKLALPTDAPRDFRSLIPTVKKLLETQLEHDEIVLKMGFTSLLSRHSVLKFLPLCVKGFLARLGRFLAPPKQTFILSNLGKIDMPETDRITEFFININCNAKTPDNIGVVSYGNRTCISFTRKKISTELERAFCARLSSLCGGAVEVISNFREKCDAL